MLTIDPVPSRPRNYPSHVLPKAETLPLSALILCGGISGAFTSLLLTPIELVKCKLQVPVTASTAKIGPLGVSHPYIATRVSWILARTAWDIDSRDWRFSCVFGATK